MFPGMNLRHNIDSADRRRRSAWCAVLLGMALAAAPAAQSADPLGDYLEAIESAEAVGGSYAVELVDLYHGMGQSLLEQGDLEEARDAFYRAAMVARVNAGPHSLEQANYLYSIADVESRMGNAGAAVEALEDVYQLHARHHGEDSAAMLPVAQQIHAWYRERMTWEGVPVRSSDYQNMSYLTARIAALTEAEYGLGDLRTAMTLRALGQSHYQAIRQVLVTGQVPDPELVMDLPESDGAYPPQRSLVAHVMQGEEALMRVVGSWQSNPAGSDLEVAEALAQLGDWNLALEFNRSAAANYEEAYRVLAQSDEFGFMADDYFGAPSPLRLMNDAGPYVRSLDPPAAEASLEVSMSVSAEGRLRDLQMVSAPTGVSAERQQEILQQLGHILFRPAVVGGKVQGVEGFVWKTPVRFVENETAP